MLLHLERTERPWCKKGLKNPQVIIDCLVSGVLDAADVKEEVLKRQKTGEFADLVPHLKLFPNHERAGVIVSSGHHVLMKSGIVCLFIGCFHRFSSHDPQAVDCVFLPLEPFTETVVAQSRQPTRNSRHKEDAPPQKSFGHKGTSRAGTQVQSFLGSSAVKLADFRLPHPPVFGSKFWSNPL